MTQALALLLSLAFELPVVLVLGRRFDIEWRRLLLVGAAATLLTHPFAWNGFLALRPWLDWWERAAVVEGAVVVIEALLYWKIAGMSGPRAGLVSLAANACSFGLGLVVNRVLLPLLG